MSVETSTSQTGTPESAPSASWQCRFAALVEVTVAFALVHVMYRATKHFTPLGRLDSESGLNFTPGAVMILFTVAILLVSQRRFTAYGITLTRWADGLKLGLLWGLMLIAGAGLLLLFRIRHEAGGPPPAMKEGIAYGLASLRGFLILARLVRPQSVGLNRVPTALCAVLLLGLLCVPLLVAWYNQRPLLNVFSRLHGSSLERALARRYFSVATFSLDLTRHLGVPSAFGGSSSGPAWSCRQFSLALCTRLIQSIISTGNSRSLGASA